MNTDVAATPVFDISDFVTDPTKENEGVWHNLGHKRRIKLARSGNPDYNRLLRAKYKANRSILEQEDDAASELNDEIMIEILAQSVIKGLEVNGVEIEYTPSKGIELLQNKDFRARIIALSGSMEAYKIKAEDAAVKS